VLILLLRPALAGLNYEFSMNGDTISRSFIGAVSAHSHSIVLGGLELMS
jgi:hypothetical protein